MTGVALVADLSALEPMAAAISRFAALDRRRLLDDLGAALVSQTQRRIKDERKSPAGVPWPAWSKRYAKTRHANQSLLIASGALVSGMTHNVISDDQVEAGSNLIYAGVQQRGWPERNIEARPYLGVSQRDGDELEAICADFIARNTPQSLS